MKCKKCGASIPDGAYFCGECGALTSDSSSVTLEPHTEERTVTQEPPQPPENVETPPVRMRRCEACGTPIQPGENYCSSCGKKVDEVNNLSPLQPKTNNTLIAVLCGITGAILVVGVVVVVIIAGTQSGLWNNMVSQPTAAPMNNTATMRPIETLSPYSTFAVNSTTAPYSSSVSSVGYLFPSDSVYITESDLLGKTQSEVRLILNEIYARNGYIFNTDTYRRYFEAQSWYRGTTTSQQEAESRFNSIERANKNFIVSYEQSRGWR